MEDKEMYINNEVLKNHFDSEFNASEFEVIAGEKIQKWIDNNFSIENGLQREPDEEDFIRFGHCDVSWMFTQRGNRLYSSYVSKVTRLAKKLFPDEPYWDFDSHAGVIYP